MVKQVTKRCERKINNRAFYNSISRYVFSKIIDRFYYYNKLRRQIYSNLGIHHPYSRTIGMHCANELPAYKLKYILLHFCSPDLF